MEDDVYVLQEIGVGNDDLEEYKEVRMKLFSTYSFLIICGILVFTLFLILEIYEIAEYNNIYFTLNFVILFLPVVLVGGYLVVIVLRTKSKCTKLIEKTWLIPPASHLFSNPKIRSLLTIMSLEMFFVIFILGYLANDVSSICSSLILLLIPIVLVILKKIAENVGYLIHRLFRGDVDQIAKKLAIALNGKKKLLIKSQNNRKYEIEFDNPYKFRVFAFHRPDKRGFVEISVMGVKPENISEAKRLISQIEGAIE